jgi:hypothetical protein
MKEYLKSYQNKKGQLERALMKERKKNERKKS